MKMKLRAFLLISLITSSIIGSNIKGAVAYAETLNNQTTISNIGSNIYKSAISAQSLKNNVVNPTNPEDRETLRNRNIQNYIDYYIIKYSTNLDQLNNLENFKNLYNTDTSFNQAQKDDISSFLDYVIGNIAPTEFKAKELNSYLRLYINLDTLKNWGIKGYINSWTSNNRDYEWYIDQMNSGVYSDNNCGDNGS